MQITLEFNEYQKLLDKIKKLENHVITLNEQYESIQDNVEINLKSDIFGLENDIELLELENHHLTAELDYFITLNDENQTIIDSIKKLLNNSK